MSGFVCCARETLTRVLALVLALTVAGIVLPGPALAQDRHEVEIVTGDRTRIEVIEERNEIWVLDERVFDPGGRGLRVSIQDEPPARDDWPGAATRGTATQGTDQSEKRGVIASCDKFYRNPSRTCSKLPGSKMGASRLSGTSMRVTGPAKTRIPASKIARGPNRLGAPKLPQSRISPSRLSASKQPLWPEERQQRSYGTTWQR
jgi:hypothetical protein